MVTFDAHKNLATGTVATIPSPATSGTSLVVTAGHGARFPAAPFYATIAPASSTPDPSNAEIVRVTAVSTDTFTITRAQGGTTARTVTAGDLIMASFTAEMLTGLEGAFQPVFNVKFYGAKGDGTTDDTAAINLALADAAAVGVLTPYLQTPAGTARFKGGGIVYFPTGTYIHTGLTLGNRVILEGDGWGSILKLKAASNAHSVTNAAHASMCSVRHLRIDGNATGQASTTVAVASNGAAVTAATLTVASTTGFPTAGSLVVTSTAGPQRVDYTGVTATTFTGCTSTGNGNGVGTVATGGKVQPLVHGIYWNYALTPDPTLDEDYDGNFSCSHVFVINATADAYCTNGRGSTHISDCKALISGRTGFRFDQDVIGSNLDTGWSLGHGFVLVGSGGGITNSKAWYCGYNGATSLWQGWSCGFVSLYNNNVIINGCSAQDNARDGLYIEGSTGLLINGFVADSNNAANVGGAGINLWQATRCMIIGSAVDNNRQPNRQPYALKLGGGNTALQIILSTAGNTSGDIDPATAVTEFVSNNINFNAEGATTPTLFTTATPSTPAQSVKIFARKRAGRSLTSQVDPTGIDYAFQPSLAQNSIGWVRPQGNGTTVASFGLTPTAIGTATAANWATTNALAQARRISYISAATAGSSGGVKHNVLQWWRGNAASLGGWHLVVRFGFASIPATRRWFVGLMGSVTTPAGDPSAIVTMCGAGQDVADTSIQFMHNDASGVATKSTGTTALASPAANEIWEVQVFAAPNASSIQMSVARLSGTFAISEYDSAASADIPANTAALLPILYANNATTAAVIDPHLLGLYIETDI